LFHIDREDWKRLLFARLLKEPALFYLNYFSPECQFIIMLLLQPKRESLVNSLVQSTYTTNFIYPKIK